MNGNSTLQDGGYQQALASLRHTLDKFRLCDEDEKQLLRRDLSELEQMHAKLTGGRIEIVLFGEISTGKSALINALLGQSVAEVDVRGGWTKEVWHVAWEGCGYCVPGLAESQVVLVDTPGLNEVGGADRATMSQEAAQRADLILFVTDSDLNDTEFSALLTLAGVNKPIIVVLNKIDLYTPRQRTRLEEVLCNERLADLVPPQNIIQAAADPRQVETIIESRAGASHSEWRKPESDVSTLKARILEILQRDGLALLALNAAMYSADKSDRIASLRVQLREESANRLIWSYMGLKSMAVAGNPVPALDMLGGVGVDAAMVYHLGKVYGLAMTWQHAEQLVRSIGTSLGWVTGSELLTHLVCWGCKAASLGWATALTSLPQGLAAGWGSYLVGQAAKFYFQHGASWAGQSPKPVIRQILQQTDKESVLKDLKKEIKKKLLRNRYADRGS